MAGAGIGTALFAAEKKRSPLLTVRIGPLFFLLWSSTVSVLELGTGREVFVWTVGIWILTTFLAPSLRYYVCMIIGNFAWFCFWLFYIPVPEGRREEVFISFLCVAILSCVLANYRIAQEKKERKETEFKIQQLKYEAGHDSLTGLFNRTQICREAKCLWKSEPDICCIMFDIDEFKEYNDSFGHLEGDRVLELFGEILRKWEKNLNGKTGRYGGEEFLMLCAGQAAERIQETVEGILKDISEKPLGRCVTVSAGASFRKEGQSFLEVLDEADRMMYEVKRDGKGKLKML